MHDEVEDEQREKRDQANGDAAFQRFGSGPKRRGHALCAVLEKGNQNTDGRHDHAADER